jgi:hypothetical protein
MPRPEARSGMTLALRPGVSASTHGFAGGTRARQGRTVVRHPHLCVPDNGRTAGGTCGGGSTEVVPRGDGTPSRWRGSANAVQERTTHATEAHEARTDSARTGDHARDGPGLMRPTRARQGLDMGPSRCVPTQSHRQRQSRELVSHPPDGLDLANFRSDGGRHRQYAGIPADLPVRRRHGWREPGVTDRALPERRGAAQHGGRALVSSFAPCHDMARAGPIRTSRYARRTP